MPKVRLQQIWIVLLLVASWVCAQPETRPQQPANPKNDSNGTQSEVEVDIRSKAVAVLAWPFEYVLQPVFGLVLYPLRPPLGYISEHNLIDKGIQLITFGEEGQTFIYPTFNMKPGSGSSIGMAYRHRNFILPPDYYIGTASLFANGDWAVATRYTKKKLLGTEMSVGTSIRYAEDRDRSFRIPDSDSYVYADTSFDIRFNWGNPLNANWGWELMAGVDFRRMDLPDLQDTLLSEVDPFRLYGGFYQDFNQYPLGLSVNYDTRDVPYAATRGSKFDASLIHVFVSDYQGPNTPEGIDVSGNHNYNQFEAKWQHYLLLGKQRYAMTTRESRENRKQMSNLSFSKAVSLFKPEQIRETLLERKVLVTQIRYRQMWESEAGMAPFVAFNSLGNSFPLRGYSDGAFTAYSVLGVSGEYRWPLDKLVDGVVFNEYGIFGRSWNNMPMQNLRNSWGFGIRVRKPDLFLTRFQLAFHGVHGIAMILTIKPAYD